MPTATTTPVTSRTSRVPRNVTLIAKVAANDSEGVTLTVARYRSHPDRAAVVEWVTLTETGPDGILLGITTWEFTGSQVGVSSAGQYRCLADGLEADGGFTVTIRWPIRLDG